MTILIPHGRSRYSVHPGLVTVALIFQLIQHVRQLLLSLAEGLDPGSGV